MNEDVKKSESWYAYLDGKHCRLDPKMLNVAVWNSWRKTPFYKYFEQGLKGLEYDRNARPQRTIDLGIGSSGF